MRVGDQACSDDVTSIILFGSHARGDADELSDFDICVFTNPVDYDQLLGVRDSIGHEYGIPPDTVNAYPAPIAEEMARIGSLFLWHLRLEGEVLADRDGFARHVFATLTPFTDHMGELNLFDTLFRDIKAQVEPTLEISEVDMHFLQTIIRSVCILLTHYAGKPTFGRLSSVSDAAGLWSELPVRLSLYGELCAWHAQYLRGVACELPSPNADKVRTMLEMVEGTLRFAREVLA